MLKKSLVKSFEMFVSICVHDMLGNLMKFLSIPKCSDSQSPYFSAVHFLEYLVIPSFCEVLLYV